MPVYKSDPRWLNVVYEGRCSRCSKIIKVNERAFWYPRGRVLLCASCGAQDSRDFEAAKFDEHFMSGA